MRQASREQVDSVKKRFQIGAQVMLLRMSDPYTKLKSGDKGIVDCVDDMGTIFVNWDNGETLGVVYGEDACAVVEHRCVVARAINGISLNGYEFVLHNDDGQISIFSSKTVAIKWLIEHGVQSEDMDCFMFFDSKALLSLGKYVEVTV